MCLTYPESKHTEDLLKNSSNISKIRIYVLSWICWSDTFLLNFYLGKGALSLLPLLLLEMINAAAISIVLVHTCTVTGYIVSSLLKLESECWHFLRAASNIVYQVTSGVNAYTRSLMCTSSLLCRASTCTSFTYKGGHKSLIAFFQPSSTKWKIFKE